eukprot:IDg22549t1
MRATVRMPDENSIVQLQAAFAARHPSLADLFCVADGLKVLLGAVGRRSDPKPFLQRVDARSLCPESPRFCTQWEDYCQRSERTRMSP